MIFVDFRWFSGGARGVNLPPSKWPSWGCKNRKFHFFSKISSGEVFFYPQVSEKSTGRSIRPILAEKSAKNHHFDFWPLLDYTAVVRDGRITQKPIFGGFGQISNTSHAPLGESAER